MRILQEGITNDEEMNYGKIRIKASPVIVYSG
ncbi:MAG: hypothetical protein Ct9H300mP28_26650 [Pseudomonadota bacterium]|nr:MAG: hypothetical protein Ct9H300mP28_26650 [Pseudomonadota bacterium]